MFPLLVFLLGHATLGLSYGNYLRNGDFFSSPYHASPIFSSVFVPQDHPFIVPLRRRPRPFYPVTSYHIERADEAIKIAALRASQIRSDDSECGEFPPGKNSKIKDVEIFSPWRAEIMMKGAYHCAGTLVGDRWILTAARCFPDPKSTKDISLLLGLRGEKVSQGGVEEVLIYPHFKPDVLTGDIALIKLKQKVEYSSKLKPACLPSQSVTADDITSSMDYFLPASELTLSGRKIERLNEEPCSNFVAKATTNTKLPNVDTCLVKSDLVETCRVLIGHPLLLKSSSKFTIVGVLSLSSAECPADGAVNIYMKVYNYTDWINEQITVL